jgi:hypothetical protein
MLHALQLVARATRCFKDADGDLDSAANVAQTIGKDAALLCPDDSDFQRFFQDCQICIKQNKETTPDTIPPLLPELGQFAEFCNIQINSTLLAEVTKSAAESAAYCAQFSFLSGRIATNCSESCKFEAVSLTTG